MPCPCPAPLCLQARVGRHFNPPPSMTDLSFQIKKVRGWVGGWVGQCMARQEQGGSGVGWHGWPTAAALPCPIPSPGCNSCRPLLPLPSGLHQQAAGVRGGGAGLLQQLLLAAAVAALVLPHPLLRRTHLPNHIHLALHARCHALMQSVHPTLPRASLPAAGLHGGPDRRRDCPGRRRHARAGQQGGPQAQGGGPRARRGAAGAAQAQARAAAAQAAAAAAEGRACEERGGGPGGSVPRGAAAAAFAPPRQGSAPRPQAGRLACVCGGRQGRQGQGCPPALSGGGSRARLAAGQRGPARLPAARQGGRARACRPNAALRCNFITFYHIQDAPVLAWAHTARPPARPAIPLSLPASAPAAPAPSAAAHRPAGGG